MKSVAHAQLLDVVKRFCVCFGMDVQYAFKCINYNYEHIQWHRCIGVGYY